MKTMRFMSIYKNIYGYYVVKADGHKSMTYIGYTKKNAIKKYREDTGINHAHYSLIELVYE